MKSLAALLGLMAMSAAPAAQANQVAMGQQQTAHKIENHRAEVKAERKRLHANRNQYKPQSWIMGNQRQNRKHWRQCPWSRPAKNRK